jgi:hypothetical protein
VTSPPFTKGTGDRPINAHNQGRPEQGRGNEPAGIAARKTSAAITGKFDVRLSDASDGSENLRAA